MALLHKKPRTIYAAHHLALRDAIKLGEKDPEWMYVAEYTPLCNGTAFIAVYEPDDNGDFTKLVGYW